MYGYVHVWINLAIVIAIFVPHFRVVCKDRWPKPRPYSGNSPAEIVEHIMAVSPPPIIKNPIQPPLADTRCNESAGMLHLSGCAHTTNAASM